MGAYLEKPITEIEEEAGEGYYFEYASASMQGWRVKQEDAHSCIPVFDPDKQMSLFAVFDGHGGPEVSRYCSEKLPDHIKADANYANGIFEEALRSSFISFDNLLKEDESAKARLWELSERCNQDSPEEDPEDFNDLLEEASMPLEAVMAKYDRSRATGEGSSKSVWTEENCSSSTKKSEPPALNGLPGSPTVKVSNGEIGTVKDGTASDTKLKSGEDSAIKTEDSEDGEHRGSGDSAIKTEDSKDGEHRGGGDPSIKTEDSKDGKHRGGGDSSIKTEDSEVGENRGGEDPAIKMEDSKDGEHRGGKDSAIKTEDSEVEENRADRAIKMEDSKVGEHQGGEDSAIKMEDSKDGEHRGGGDPAIKMEDSKDGEHQGGGDPAIKMEDSKDGEHQGGGDPAIKFKNEGDGEDQEGGDTARQPSNTPKIGKSSGKSTGGNSGKSPLKKRQSGRLLVKAPRCFSADDDTSSSDLDSSEQEEEEEEEEEEVDGDAGDWEDMTTSSEATSEDDDDDDLPEYLRESQEEEEPGVDSGTTAVVALLTKDRVVVANVGDSRAILGRLHPAEGDKPAYLEAIDLSFDHKPELPEEKLRVVQAGGYVDKDGRVDGGLNLSRALGDHVFKRREDLPPEEQRISPMPDIHVETLKLPHDLSSTGDQFLFIACDGIWNEMSSQQAADFIWTRMCKLIDLNTICRELFEHCLSPNTHGDGTGCDNMTAVLVRLYKPPGDEANDKKREAEGELEESPTKKIKN